MDCLLSERSPSLQEASPTHFPGSEAIHLEETPAEPLTPQPTQASSWISPSYQETCPKCSSRLGPPLKSSGRQVCVRCGWTNRPKGTISSQQDETVPRAVSASVNLPDYELKKLLDQAASESLNNMKPKRKQPQNQADKNKLLPPEGEKD